MCQVWFACSMNSYKYPWHCYNGLTLTIWHSVKLPLKDTQWDFFLTVKMNTVHHCCFFFFFACREPDLRCSSVVDCSTLRDISRAQRADWGEVFWKSKARWPGEGNQGSLVCRLSNGGKLALTSKQAYKTRLQGIFYILKSDNQRRSKDMLPLPFILKSASFLFPLPGHKKS